MILDAISVSQHNGTRTFKKKAISSFLSFLEKKVGAKFLYNTRDFPFGRVDLQGPFAIAAKLKRAGIIKYIEPLKTYPDEPSFKSWGARLVDSRASWTNGGSFLSDEKALYAALAEGLERYIWSERDDFFDQPIKATVSEMEAKKRMFLHPATFVGFNENQRKADERLALDPGAQYLWIKGQSLTSGKKVYLPAQIVSGKHFEHEEPLIRPRVTNGLATWVDITGARLRGVLEVIERDAYMIMWTNQLSLPRINLDDFRKESTTLSKLLEKCERYGFRIHAVRLITDAPAHVVTAVVEDMSGNEPRFIIGNKAGRNLLSCFEGALLEALRIRTHYRNFFASDDASKWDPNTPASEIGHFDRLFYWGVGERSEQLKFLIGGKEESLTKAIWENDSDEEHLNRIIAWCRKRNYEYTSVSLGTSKCNPTKLSVEMAIVPQMQPMHLYEWHQSLDGKRIKEIPKMLGYESRKTPFSEPHLFC